MIYVSHIYVVMKNGFIETTKLQKEIDMTTLKQGDNIISFYGEVLPLYNILFTNENNDAALFENGKLNFLNQKELEEKIKTLFPLLINQIASSKVGDLLNDFLNSDGSINRPSNFNEYLDIVQSNTDYKLTPCIEEFSLEKYRHIANELQFLCDCVSIPKLNMVHFVKRSVLAFNNFLAYEGIVKNFKEGLFSPDKNRENKKIEMSYSSALKCLYDAERCCDASFSFQNIDKENIKPKF